MITLPKTKEQRINHYRILIKKLRANDYGEGICIILGNICGGFAYCPWSGWRGLINYYPELKKYSPPRDLTFSINKRKRVVESLALRINKKKDIYFK